MNLDFPSIIANRMFAFDETFAAAKAFVLNSYSTDPSGDGTVLDSMESDITTVGGEPLSDRDPATYPWYRGNTLFADSPASSGGNLAALSSLDLTGQAGKVVGTTDGYTLSMVTEASFALPDPTGHDNQFLQTDGTDPGWADPFPAQSTHSGEFLTTDGAGTLSWASAAGVTLAAFGSTPNDNGLSLTGSALNMQPASVTKPGGVSVGDQDMGGGIKRFSGGFVAAKTLAGKGFTITDDGSNAFAVLGYFAGGSGITADHSVLVVDAGHTYYGADTHIFRSGAGYTTYASMAAAGLDLSTMNVGAYIKLRSPDGTTYTLTVANGGTLNIA